MRFSLIKNNYDESKKIFEELINNLSLKNHILDIQNPEYIFVIGGDGTFLKAVQEYNYCLDNVIFILIKSGGIGYYTNHNRCDNYQEIINNNFMGDLNIKEHSLLELNNKYLSLNEIKIIQDSKPIEIDVKVNEKILEAFKGTGLYFSTTSGTTGFNKSTGGPIIYPELNLFVMNEIFPVSTNKFRTLNAPIVFSKEQEIKLKIKGEYTLILDTKIIDINEEMISIKISDKKVKVLSVKKNEISKTKILNDLFVLKK